MSATCASNRHFFSCKKKTISKKVSVLVFFFLHFSFSFWRRVPRLAPIYWPILVEQILNQWMNLKKRVFWLFRPNQTGDSAETVKPQGNQALYQEPRGLVGSSVISDPGVPVSNSTAVNSLFLCHFFSSQSQDSKKFQTLSHERRWPLHMRASEI